jgi:hypothetical protein
MRQGFETVGEMAQFISKLCPKKQEIFSLSAFLKKASTIKLIYGLLTSNKHKTDE